MTPEQAIAGFSDTGGPMFGDDTAVRIVQRLESAGYVIVRKEPPDYMHSQAKAAYRMNMSVGKAT